MTKSKISSCLWFDTQAEDAAKFYTSVFPNSKITAISRYSEAGPGPAGSVMTVSFELDGREFLGLNGGPVHKFNQAISLVVDCDTQEEVDRYWQALLAGGGSEDVCGWLKDKFGLSWQVVPKILRELVTDTDPKKSARVMQAMFTMRKLEIAPLQKAYAGR